MRKAIGLWVRLDGLILFGFNRISTLIHHLTGYDCLTQARVCTVGFVVIIGIQAVISWASWAVITFGVLGGLIILTQNFLMLSFDNNTRSQAQKGFRNHRVETARPARAMWCAIVLVDILGIVFRHQKIDGILELLWAAAYLDSCEVLPPGANIFRKIWNWLSRPIGARQPVPIER